ncbi:1-phosphofructokinase [Lentzea sp. NBRC 105346]|uniref:1-phosphofructokinase family hexose kinase n=1 Tax=Lentzea sp. NBRC 105346 TaxID=3032205 RepID=UPI0024A56605|nr:PfkB family carbohydrate kinase [Lentzea sp. NBRC 105346]GLZ31071.1 1-phosphofructokinase [Lentzea sp. NBRC 105346]
MADRVVVFAPSPQLTITVEDLDGEPDVHLHAGGQGFWQARMIAALGVEAVLCAGFGGETGRVLRTLVLEEGIVVRAREVAAQNSAYIHLREEDGRTPVVEMPAAALSRHELDDLHELTLVEGLRAGTAVLSGPTNDRVLPADTYRRLTADLSSNGCQVVVDLAGERLSAALEGGPAVIKVSHEELGLSKVPELVEAVRELASGGARIVVVSRAEEPALALIEGELHFVELPSLEPVDTRGAGDSMTAGMAAALAEGCPAEEAVRLGAAAGAVNVTRHGLGSGRGEAVRAMAERVVLKPIEDG